MNKSADIEIRIEYRDNTLKSIKVDGIELDNLSYIKDKPIEEWNKPSTGRANWKGLINEINSLVADDKAGHKWDFENCDDPPAIEELFKKLFGNIEGLDDAEFIKRRQREIVEAEHRYDYLTAVSIYVEIAERLDTPETYYEAARYALKSLESTREKDHTDIIAIYIDTLKKAADRHMDVAVLEIFKLYDEGDIVEQNREEALKWLIVSGNNGNVDSQLEIADRYFEGLLIEEDESQAFFWYQKASQSDNPRAHKDIADCYCYGIGCVKDETTAYHHYSRAAELGNEEAEVQKAIYLTQGIVCNADLNGAYKSFSKVKHIFDKDNNALYWAGYCCEQLGVYDEAVDYYELSVQLKNYNANYRLAKIYLEEKCGKENIVKAEELLIAVAVANDAGIEYKDKAIFQLAECYAMGVFGTIDHSAAFRWYSCSAEYENPEACNIVGEYFEGLRGDKKIDTNLEEAFKFYQKAARKQLPKGNCNLGRCYYYGIGTEDSYIEAEKRYLIAIEQGSVHALYYLAILYDEGLMDDGGDYATAFKYYKEFADLNIDPKCSPVAQYKVSIYYRTGNAGFKDKDLADQYLALAANNGYDIAQYDMGMKCKEIGHISTATIWFKRAAEQGNNDARFELGILYKSYADYANAAHWLKYVSGKRETEAKLYLAECYEYMGNTKASVLILENLSKNIKIPNEYRAEAYYQLAMAKWKDYDVTHRLRMTMNFREQDIEKYRTL